MMKRIGMLRLGKHGGHDGWLLFQWMSKTDHADHRAGVTLARHFANMRPPEFPLRVGVLYRCVAGLCYVRLVANDQCGVWIVGLVEIGNPLAPQTGREQQFSRTGYIEAPEAVGLHNDPTCGVNAICLFAVV